MCIKAIPLFHCSVTSLPSHSQSWVLPTRLPWSWWHHLLFQWLGSFLQHHAWQDHMCSSDPELENVMIKYHLRQRLPGHCAVVHSLPQSLTPCIYTSHKNVSWTKTIPTLWLLVVCIGGLWKAVEWVVVGVQCILMCMEHELSCEWLQLNCYWACQIQSVLYAEAIEFMSSAKFVWSTGAWVML